MYNYCEKLHWSLQLTFADMPQCWQFLHPLDANYDQSRNKLHPTHKIEHHKYMRISKPHGCKVKTLAESLGFNREICTSWKEFTNFHSKKFGASSDHISWWGHRMNNTKNRGKWLVGSSESFLSTKIIMRPIPKDVYLCEKPWHRCSVQLFHKLLEGFECNATALSIRIEVGQICLHQWTQVPHAGFIFLHLRLILWVSINFLKISKSKGRLD